MPLFDYTGQLQSGSAFQGTLEADSNEHAHAILIDMGVRVTWLHPAKRLGFVTPLSLDEVTLFNDHLASLTQASTPLEPSLRALAADVGSRRLKRVLIELADRLAGGESLDTATKALAHRFPPGYAGVMEAGVRSGNVGGTLAALAAHLRLKGEVRRAMIELATYPLFVLLLALGIVAFAMRVVVPAFGAMLRDFGFVRPPAMTAALLWAAGVWPTVEFAFLVAVLLIVGLVVLLRLPPMRGTRAAILRRLPGVGGIYGASVLARFSYTAALAALSGRTLPEILHAAGAAGGDPETEAASRRVAERVVSGQPLTIAAAGEKYIPPLWVTVATASGPRGDLPSALRELAQAYEARAQHRARTVRILLGPILLIVVGAILGVVILGILLPMLQLIQSLTA